MNPKTVLRGILGAFSIKLTFKGNTYPFFFVLVKNLQFFDTFNVGGED